jgi:uncharacterized membrane protein
MSQRLSMATRHEITKKYTREYKRASKKDKGRMLDDLVAVTGWSRANAQRAITSGTFLASAFLIGVCAGQVPFWWLPGVLPKSVIGWVRTG